MEGFCLKKHNSFNNRCKYVIIKAYSLAGHLIVKVQSCTRIHKLCGYLICDPSHQSRYKVSYWVIWSVLQTFIFLVQLTPGLLLYHVLMSPWQKCEFAHEERFRKVCQTLIFWKRIPSVISTQGISQFSWRMRKIRY